MKYDYESIPGIINVYDKSYRETPTKFPYLKLVALKNTGEIIERYRQKLSSNDIYNVFDCILDDSKVNHSPKEIQGQYQILCGYVCTNYKGGPPFIVPHPELTIIAQIVSGVTNGGNIGSQ